MGSALGCNPGDALHDGAFGRGDVCSGDRPRSGAVFNRPRRVIPQPHGLQRDVDCGERVPFDSVHHSHRPADPVHQDRCGDHSWR